VRDRRSLDAFVGRDAELDALRRPLDRALAGDTAVALVSGEAGIGKSRLADALAAEARHRAARVVWGEAHDDHRAPLALWSPVERALGVRSGDGELPSSERRWDLVDVLVAELADAAPVVVVLEDLHWADEASVWVLERLPRRLPGRGVLLVGTTRRDEPGAVPLTGVRRQADAVVELEGLDVEATERLIDALAVDDARYQDSRRHAADLVGRTGGNPLFLRELLALGSRGDRLPRAVSDVLTRSLARLDEPVREALAALALAGPATPVAVLTAALRSTVDAVMDRFDTAAAADVVTLGPAGRPAFRHVLLAEAAADAVPPSRTRRLHAALADAWAVLDSSPHGAARAATHRLAALPHGDALAAGDQALAAVADLRQAGDAGAAAELAGAAGLALEAAGPTPGVIARRARVEVELARALVALGDDVGAGDVFARAADLLLDDPAPDPDLRAEAEAGSCRRANPFVAQPDRLRRLAEADAALPPGDHPRRVDVLGRMAVLRVAVPGNLAAAHADADAAVAIARRLGDPDLLVTALTDRHYVPAGVDGLAARAAAADEMVALGERLRRPDVALQGYEWRFGDRIDRGERNAANAALDALEAYGLVMPSPKWRWSALIRRSTLHAVDGDRAGLLACADQVATLGEDVATEPEVLGMEFAIRATASQLWGVKDDRVDDLCAAYDEICRPLQHLPFMALLMARAWCAIRRPENAAATVHRYAAHPEPLFDILEGIAVVARLGAMVAELGMAEHAERLRRALLPFADRLGTGSGIQLHPPVATTLGQLALLLGDTATAVADHERAVAMAEAMPSPTLVAITHAHLATARAAVGDGAGATAAADRARRAAGPIGMVLVDLEVDPAPPPAAAGRERRASLARQPGDTWRVASPHGAATVPHSLGLAQLARLLAAPPGAEVAATELAGIDAAPVPVARDLGAALDARAKREYRRRITELQDDIDEAEAHHDPERAARARLELDALVQELRRAVGLDGRDRPTGSGAERARVNVTRSLRRAVAAVADQLPELGAHLERSVRTGRFCSYSPEPSAALTWETAP
jgi:hypothetical protein